MISRPIEVLALDGLWYINDHFKVKVSGGLYDYVDVYESALLYIVNNSLNFHLSFIFHLFRIRLQTLTLKAAIVLRRQNRSPRPKID